MSSRKRDRSDAGSSSPSGGDSSPDPDEEDDDAQQQQQPAASNAAQPAAAGNDPVGFGATPDEVRDQLPVVDAPACTFFFE